MDLTLAMILLFQMIVGILGNFSLMIHQTVLHFFGCNSRPTDLILRHLVVANALAILSKGVPQIMLALGLTHHLNDVGCNLFLYFERVARGVSIFTTCLLSVFQVITISPLHSRWAGLKLKALKYVGPSSILCWILHMLVNAIFPVYVSSKWTNTTAIIIKKNVFKYCSKHYDNVTCSLYVALIYSHDVLCLGFMSLASGSMVFILCRHKQRVQHIYNNNMTSKCSVETRATESILTLEIIYASSYTFSTMAYSYLPLTGSSAQWLMSTSAFILMFFPTVSPFVRISSDSRVSRFFAVCYSSNT
ncbi:PREDICTED: vomeronasal type-1 receptor 2-like [Elephantulus edwardii]|uniref:vomeronasal type-1 receptor 2-like n=1 Tax=Elephantulus edwardii TaxID=28737 RepID=UPI0003F05B6A|nr:PREDICTED: vomeronasal type-1 receptor 2-like [Elephantulus edwardii]